MISNEAEGRRTRMVDREKVLKGLECCQECSGYTCRNCCPYYDRNEPESQPTCTCRLAHDALTLLKVQEPVKPVFDAGDGKTIGQFLCGKCHAKIGFGHPHFCWYCGRAVKWE